MNQFIEWKPCFLKPEPGACNANNCEKPGQQDSGCRSPIAAAIRGGVGREIPMISIIYKQLKKIYGPQGWWPIVNRHTLRCEYHVGRLLTGKDRFEIVIGSLLTQNVAWKNAEKALANLIAADVLYPEKLSRLTPGEIAPLIRPAGYYNQKAIKIKNFCEWFARFNYSFSPLLQDDTAPLRQALLSVKGIGPETADSILLYALDKKTFVVDAYTRRIFTRSGTLTGNESYDAVQEIFHRSFSSSIDDYREYHALIVAHGKDFCKKKPLCLECGLAQYCTGIQK